MKLFAPHLTDFYKTGHIFQYPEKTQLVYTNFTPRSDKWFDGGPDYDHKVVFYGLQGVCKWMLRDLWNSTFFSQPKDVVVKKYQNRMDSSLGPGSVPVEHIAALHDLGYLPIRIKALPEGSRVNMRVPCYTIQNTHDDFGWVTNYLETPLSAETWKPMTTATIAYEYRKMFKKFAELTGTPKEFLPWQGHDFAMRGLSGVHDASNSASGHLTSFYGTDTIPAIDYIDEYYGDGSFIGGSVPATEHSVMCMGGKETEIETFRRLLKTYPTGILSIVSDTWDYWQVLDEFMPELKNEIMSRQKDALGFAKVVNRPDSGDPVKILTGDSEIDNIDDPRRLGSVSTHWKNFGGTYTTKGFRQIDEHVGLIYGDSITLKIGRSILENLYEKGFASGNIVFGIGSHTYQYVTRDTFGTAMKATFGVVDGEDRVLYKQPKTDNGVKFSAKGLLRVEQDNDGNFVLFEEQTRDQESQGLLKTVFENSQMVSETNITEIRNRLHGSFV